MRITKILRSGLNVCVLFTTLVVTPLLALSHFNAGLATMLGELADSYLPNATLLTTQKKARVRAQDKLHKTRVADARARASTKTKASAKANIVNAKGKRVLVRGAGALAVGWVPILGATADIASLSEDYSDICEMFGVMDELMTMLYLPDSNLYEDNYCHLPDEGMRLITEAATDTDTDTDGIQKSD